MTMTFSSWQKAASRTNKESLSSNFREQNATMSKSAHGSGSRLWSLIISHSVCYQQQLTLSIIIIDISPLDLELTLLWELWEWLGCDHSRQASSSPNPPHILPLTTLIEGGNVAHYSFWKHTLEMYHMFWFCVATSVNNEWRADWSILSDSVKKGSILSLPYTKLATVMI